MGNWLNREEDQRMEKVMANESAYERRRREASEVISQHEYAGQMEKMEYVEAMKPVPKYKEFGITTMLSLVQSALGSLEDNTGRLNSKIEPVLSESANTSNMASSDPMPPLESGLAQDLHTILRRIQDLDNFVAFLIHRVDL